MCWKLCIPVLNFVFLLVTCTPNSPPTFSVANSDGPSNNENLKVPQELWVYSEPKGPEELERYIDMKFLDFEEPPKPKSPKDFERLKKITKEAKMLEDLEAQTPKSADDLKRLEEAKALQERANHAGWHRFEWVTPNTAPGLRLARASAPDYNDIVGKDYTQNLGVRAVEFIEDMGFDHIISLNEHHLNVNARRLLANRGITYTHIPVSDFQQPMLINLEKGYAQYVKHQASFLYCGYGYGRTGTMISAIQIIENAGANGAEIPEGYLMWKNHVESANQFRILRELKSHAYSIFEDNKNSREKSMGKSRAMAAQTAKAATGKAATQAANAVNAVNAVNTELTISHVAENMSKMVGKIVGGLFAGFVAAGSIGLSVGASLSLSSAGSSALDSTILSLASKPLAAEEALAITNSTVIQKTMSTVTNAIEGISATMNKGDNRPAARRSAKKVVREAAKRAINNTHRRLDSILSKAD